MKARATADEKYPYAFVTFDDDPPDPTGHDNWKWGGRDLNLTQDELADLHRARAEWGAWQDRILTMLGQ